MSAPLQQFLDSEVQRNPLVCFGKFSGNILVDINSHSTRSRMKQLIFDPDCAEKSLREFVARELRLNPAVTPYQLERLIVGEGGSSTLKQLGEQWRLGDPLTVERLMASVRELT